MSDKNSKIALGKGIAKIGSVLVESLISYFLEKSAEKSGITTKDIIKFEKERRKLLRSQRDNITASLLENGDNDERQNTIKNLLKKIDKYDGNSEIELTKEERKEIELLLSNKKLKKPKKEKRTEASLLLNDINELYEPVKPKRTTKINQIVPVAKTAERYEQPTTVSDTWNEIEMFNSNCDKSLLFDDLHLNL